MVAEPIVPWQTSPRGGKPLPLSPEFVKVTMQALDRLPWPVQHRVTIAGVRVLVRGSSRSMWETVLTHVPEGRRFPTEIPPAVVYSVTPAGGPHLLGTANQHVVYRGTEPIEQDEDTDVVFKGMLSDLTATVAQATPRWTFIHAGAVSWNGAGIILPGPSGSGKSTLVAALLRLGARYHSDEVAVLDSAGFLHPYHKPLWLKPVTMPELEAKILIPVDRLCGRKDHRARPVRLVAFPDWKEGARLRMRHVPRAVAALGIFSNGFSAETHPVRSLNHATKGVARAACVQLQYGEAEAVAEKLIRLLDAGSGLDRLR